MQRYFGEEKDGNLIILKNEDFHHIKNVVRLKPNDKIIVNLNNKSYLCNLSDNLKTANIINEVKTISNTNVRLFVPLLNDNKMSFIIEKSVELGVMEIVVINLSKCKYSISKEKIDKKIDRWNRIALSASKQCGRINIPKVKGIINIEDITVEKLNIVCSVDTNNVKYIKKVLNSYNSCDIIQVVFGPEGGLSYEEEDLLVKKGFIKVSLGDRILRTETVGLFVLSVINYELEKE